MNIRIEVLNNLDGSLLFLQKHNGFESLRAVFRTKSKSGTELYVGDFYINFPGANFVKSPEAKEFLDNAKEFITNNPTYNDEEKEELIKSIDSSRKDKVLQIQLDPLLLTNLCWIKFSNKIINYYDVVDTVNLVTHCIQYLSVETNLKPTNKIEEIDDE